MNLSHKAETALKLVREAKELSFDTETSGVDWKIHNPVGYVFHADGAPSVYVPIRHGGGENLSGGQPLAEADSPISSRPWEKELAKAFVDRERLGLLTLGHNLQFDGLMSWNAGVKLGRNLACTQNRQVLIDEHTPKFSLDALCQSYGVTAKKGDELYQHIAAKFGGRPDRSAMANFWRLSGTDRLGVDYAEGDGVSTLELFEAQLPEIKKQGLERVTAVEDRLIWTLVRMERHGIKLDLDYLGSFVERMEAKAEAAKSQLPDGLNVRSGVQMKAWMDELGHTDYPITENGNASFPEKWLETNEAGRAVLAARKATNVVNTFARPLIERHNYKGRVHTHINQNRGDEYGTITGRISASNPNLTAFPKHNRELALPLRRGFVADEGMMLWECDYSQLEPRLYTHYSGAKHLMEGYNADPPMDAHTVVADMLKVDRATTGKRMNMGLFTFMGVETFSRHMGVSAGEARRMYNAWFNLFPEIKKFQVSAKNRMLRRGYVHTLLGRRARIDDRRFAYKAVSRIIQGCAADIVKYVMVNVDEAFERSGTGAFLQLQIHDSLVWNAPDTPEGEEISVEAVRLMEDVNGDPFNLRLPFVVEPDKGRDWAVSSYGEKAVKEYFDAQG